MIFEILHNTEYNYSGKVFLEPHSLRFKPRNTPHSFLREFTIRIDPDVSGLSEQIDPEQNQVITCWFDDLHDKMKITARSVVEAKEFNPFNFIIQPTGYLNFPFTYGKRDRKLLQPSLETATLADPISGFLQEIGKKSENHTIAFLSLLTKEVHEMFTLLTRETGQPQSPEESFEKKKGSCRDLAWMQIHMLRNYSFASRFVSGYYYLDAEDPEFELHAWLEVFLPGAGWIGLDPSHGMFCQAFHIPVASSAFYENTMPVSGTFRGTADAVMQNEVKILFTP